MILSRRLLARGHSLGVGKAKRTKEAGSQCAISMRSQDQNCQVRKDLDTTGMSRQEKLAARKRAARAASKAIRAEKEKK